MSNPTFIKAYESSAAIGANLIVRFSDAANGSKIGPASASNQPLVGTTGKIGASAAGQMTDVDRVGIGRVRLGGPVNAGDWLTSDANAKAIATTTIGHQTIGRAEAPGVADDIISYFAAPGTI